MTTLLLTILLSCLFVTHTFASAENATSTSTSAPSQAPATSGARQGYTQSPQSRGTLDIIWNCLVTLTLASWSSLCLNVPRPGASKWNVLLVKTLLTGLCVMGPEFICLIAVGQLMEARRTCRMFHDLGYTSGRNAWKMTQSFYAEMGGFVVIPAGSQAPFPVDGRQLHYLVKNKYVDYPETSAEDIQDRNKSDGLLRLIALGQASWFVANLISRPIQGLAITSLELTTAAFIFFGALTSCIWFKKPADVTTRITVHKSLDIERILLDADQPTDGSCSRTPLDFVWDKDWSFSIAWNHGLAILERVGFGAGYDGPFVNHFRNSIISPVNGTAFILLALLTEVYFGILTLGWNHPFPTSIEQLLYRISCIVCLASTPLFTIALDFGFKWWPYLQERLSKHGASHKTGARAAKPRSKRMKGVRGALHQVAEKIRNNDTHQNKKVKAPLKSILAIWAIGLCYVPARAYIILEDFVELRSLEASAYVTVDWSWVLPHFT